MPTLAITPDYLARLILKARALQSKEGEVDPEAGSNPIDDNAIDTLQDDGEDLSREELREEIQGLDDRQQAELVALFWLGRGDIEPDEWEETVDLAHQRRTRPTAQYLLGQPLVADYWSEGAERLRLAAGA